MISSFSTDEKTYGYYDIKKVHEDVTKLPYSIRILLESLVRQKDDHAICEEHVRNLANWGTSTVSEKIDVPFKPSRIILQDFTGVPVVVDLASMRKAMADLGGNPELINPAIPVDLVIDHSVQVDKYGSLDALNYNMNLEFERNEERYQFLHWATQVFDNYRAVPPATGIVHQVNLEYLAEVVYTKEVDGQTIVYPDSVFGTDSHTTMINGVGVLGWGVGGIEAEAAMLGQPSYLPVPEVLGVKLVGKLSKGVTATDLALYITSALRKKGVVGKFVEFFGEGMKNISLADRATISNMAPEYGATCGFFPIDDQTLDYLRLTGRKEEHVQLIEAYSKANQLFYDEKAEPVYSDVLVIDLREIEPSLSGPKRPQDLVTLSQMKDNFRKSVTAPAGNHGFGLSASEWEKKATVQWRHGTEEMQTGDLAIAAITSCTNTSNPYVMLAAGLVAKKAVEYGLQPPKFVKTSLAPGSKVVTGYLDNAGLLDDLEKIGFHVVGYGCTTCIGNSGPLTEEVTKAIVESDLLVSSVLSGNRNFEGRVHPLVKANYLASPPMVVVYALAGTVDIDLLTEPIGKNKQGKDVFFHDVWPDSEEVDELVAKYVTPELFQEEYKTVFDSNDRWNQIETTAEALYPWDEDSTYIQNPPYFEKLSGSTQGIKPLENLRVLGKFGDSVTTDHISPAGSFSSDTPAGKFLREKGVQPVDFNSYGARRGNHEVMMRGTFANIRIRNEIAGGKEGGFTTHWSSGEVMPIFDAARRYQEEGTGLLVIAGKDYGMGSSRDWAAKGTNLLGVKAVLAESFERIHRSNLVMMGVLPLQFLEGESVDSLGLVGDESFTIKVDESVQPRAVVQVTAVSPNKERKSFQAVVRFDSEVDIDYYRHGGILQMVLKEKLEV